MSKTRDLLTQGKHEELWKMCCGFLDLDMQQFMEIQKRLLMEQVELLKNCALGRKVMRGAMPNTLEEFRQHVPLTTYTDYCPELLEKREDVLPVKPKMWLRTSGRSGEYPKWVPWSERIFEELETVLCGGAILASCSHKGDIRIDDRLKILHAIAPAPYTFGVLAIILQDSLDFRFLPSLAEAESMSFEDRLKKGFKLALSQGLDGFYGLPSVLVAIGEQFKAGSRTLKISALLSEPKILLRLIKGLLTSKIQRRQMLPKDLWSIKFIAAGGTDGIVYKQKIEEMWGRRPLIVYGGTEIFSIAVQTWDYDTMTFFPNLNFFEFIPESEYFKWHSDNSYQPKTILLDEVEPGQNYEVVITNFHGGVMVRYRVGDMIRITSLKNDRLGINIPQMNFERRADDLIDISGFTRLTERIIWQALENSGIPYVDWTTRKEVEHNRPILHLYLELKPGYSGDVLDMDNLIYEQLMLLDQDCADLKAILGINPIKISLLPQGVFKSYTEARRAEGADLAHLKVPHINPTDKMISLLGGVSYSAKD